MAEPWDLAVVGAGPAGLAAAVAAAESGASVVLVDAGPQPGGQYWRHPVGGPGPGEETYRSLRSRFDTGCGSGRIDYLPDHQVWFLDRHDHGIDLRLTGLTTPAVRSRVRARAVILCPGGYDRQLPIPGWDLPGVMTAGGVQALAKGHHLVPGHRVVVAGTGPFLLPVATGLVEAGAEVVAVLESAGLAGWLPGLPAVVTSPGKLAEGAAYAGALLRHRIPFRTRTVVTAIEGTDAVEAVRVARLDGQGRIRLETERRLEADLVALGWGFTPSLELVVAAGAQTRVDVDESLVAQVDDDQQSSVAGIYVAGEATGVGGAQLAVAEGELAGLAAAGQPVDSRSLRRLRHRVRRGRAFAAALHHAHPIPIHWADWLTPETIVCRCEEVDHATICAVRDELGADDARTVKLLARPGMGWCQGKVCGFAVAKLATTGPLTVADLSPGSKRSLAAPVTLQSLADLETDLDEPR